MTIRVQLFAGAREAAGRDTIDVELEEGATYAALAEALAKACPRIAPLVERSRFASGAKYVAATELVDAEQEIALIPPVSGG